MREIKTENNRLPNCSFKTIFVGKWFWLWPLWDLRHALFLASEIKRASFLFLEQRTNNSCFTKYLNEDWTAPVRACMQSTTVWSKGEKACSWKLRSLLDSVMKTLEHLNGNYFIIWNFIWNHSNNISYIMSSSIYLMLIVQYFCSKFIFLVQ